MKIAFYTLGCKTNQYETQAMAQICQDSLHGLCLILVGLASKGIKSDFHVISTKLYVTKL